MAALASAARCALQALHRLPVESSSGFLRTIGASAAALVMLAGVAQPAHALTATQRLDLKVLLLSADGTEPSLAAWSTALTREGVPFDTIVAVDAPPIDAATLTVGSTRGRYQAIVLATGGLVQCTASGCASALDAGEWSALNTYQAQYGVRRVTAYAYPSPEYGMNWPFAAGDLSGSVADLTAAGLTAFPQLAGKLPMDAGTYGYYAEPLVPAAGVASPFKTLVAGPVGPGGAASSLVGVYARPEGFEELVVTYASNQWQLQSLLLGHGLIQWATKGVHLGYQRAYFTMHIDDVFLGDDRWDTQANFTFEGDAATLPPVRMVPADVDRALAWQQSTGLQLDFVFNGAGSDDAVAANGSDPLTTKLLSVKSQFSWINHTYTHMNLDFATQAQIVSEITKNRKWANGKGISIINSELVTGEHSGLANPLMPAALTQAGILWTAADNSKQPTPYKLGSATTIPRYPSNVYYNVGTFAEQLDEYNYIYFDNCVNTATTTCFTQPATWAQYIDNEASIMLRHLLLNDPRPHYFHQSNLAEDGTFYPVVNEVLARYKGYVKVPLVQPTYTQTGQLMTRASDWTAAWTSATPANGYYLNGKVYVTSPSAATVPLTGTANGQLYGTERSIWVKVGAGATQAYTSTVKL